jgi:hypothetical protein
VPWTTSADRAPHRQRRAHSAADACGYGRLTTVRARRRDVGREAAAKGVAACLADDDAEVYNLTEAAIQENALTAALNLTALAAEAVAELAATRKVQPQQVLRSLTEGQFDTANHSLGRQLAMQAVYPASMDDYDWAMTEAKGWIEITVRSTEGEKAITFYDPARLAQEVQGAMTESGYFAESAVVVVPTVTREAIEAVIARLARSGFTDIS